MNKIATASVVALLLGATTPFALSSSAIASGHPVEVTFSGPLAADLGLDEGEIIALPFSLAAEVCPGLTDETTSCTATDTTEELEDFLEELDDDDGDSNSAKEFAPGHNKKEGEVSAKSVAPGQVKEDGESARESAPGQQKKSDD